MEKKSDCLSKTLVLVIAGFLSLASCGKTVSSSSNDISTQTLRSHMEAIASDDTQGRMTASSGFKRAADYAAEQLRSFGLEPGWTDGSGARSFYQPVPFIRNQYEANSRLYVRRHAKTEEYPIGPDTYVVADPGRGPLSLSLQSPVFVGFGIHEPELGWDDFSSLDIRGKLAVIMAGFPQDPRTGPDFPPEVRRKYSDRRNGDALRFRNVMMKGAAGIIALPDGFMAAQWDGIVAQLKRSALVPAETYGPTSRGQSPVPSLLVHPDLARQVVSGLGFDPTTYEGDYRTFEMKDVELGLTLETKREEVHCFNVIGVILGTDPELSREYITLGAHLDHLGKEGNVIYNGANDDASGCALVLAIAAAVAQHPPQRSVIFALFTAEEIGHFGSLHFVAHPPVPHEQVILNINLEQIGAKSRLVDGVGAYGPVSQQEILREAQGKLEGLVLQFNDIEATVPVIAGSDTLSFYQKGLPAILLGSGGFPEHHTPNDNLDLIDYEHLHRAALFVLDYVKALGHN